MTNTRRGLWLAFGYNTAGIPIAAGVLYPALGWLLSPMVAAAAMALSSSASSSTRCGSAPSGWRDIDASVQSTGMKPVPSNAVSTLQARESRRHPLIGGLIVPPLWSSLALS
jgi:4-hydroxybenzoate polyprenyltransferase